MTQPTETYDSYDAIGNREDLSDIIYNISPVDTPILSTIPKVSASNRVSEWQTDALADTSVAGAIEGDDAAGDALVATVRLNNITHIVERTVVVSGSQEVIESAGRGSELDYQVAMKMREMKRSMEAIITDNNIKVTGDATTAREMAGMGAWVATNDVFPAGGASPTVVTGLDARTDATQVPFTEDDFKTSLQLTFDSGGNPTMVSLGSFNKQRFSAFSGNATRFDKSEDAQLVATVDIYRSDFGRLKIVPNRFQRSRDAWILDTDFWALAELRPMFSHDLAKTGDSLKRQMLWEATLHARNEAASGGVFDLTTS